MSPSDPGPREWDVVVVGAGAAGCVVAARLAETSSRSVLLLEAGPDRRAELPDDFRDGWGINRQDLDWGYLAEEDEKGSRVPVRRKRLVGGTSWLTRFTPRGGPADYDSWSELGLPGWAWEEVLPHFVRLETDDDFGDRPWHGDSGPIPSRRYLDVPYLEIVDVTIDALAASGFERVDDHNRPGAVGVGRMPMNSRDGVRVTTADAYLPPGSTPRNLTVRPDAQVGEVVLDGSRAAGVRLVDGTVVGAGAVVLSAGVFGSPAILMRSGIGPAEHLRSLGIPVLLELDGVGANLADHPALDLELPYEGPGREAPLLHAIATFHSGDTPPEQPPDLMFWLSDPTGDPAEYGIAVVLLKPRSRGAVQLRSADPLEPPGIVLPRLCDLDVRRLAEGYRRALEVAKVPAVRRLCAGSPTEPADSDELGQRILAEAISVPHTVGTCAMGPDPDRGAVVDEQGRVHGVEALFVADASIMPEVPSGFTHVPTIMIGERLAGWIGPGT